MNAVLLMLAAYLAVMSSQFGPNIQVTDDVWNSYKLEHGKQYSSVAEEALRRQVFAYNHHKAEKFNRENPNAGYELGISHLSDLTTEEFNVRNGFRMPEDVESLSTINQRDIDLMLSDFSDTIPDEVDWRKVDGIVGGIKDQGQCGGCWAFSTTGLLEGQELAHNGTRFTSGSKLVDLSEQELLDCDTVDQGCDGGNMIFGLQYIHEAGGIESEKDYPYEAKRKKCRFNRKKMVMINEGYRVLEAENEDLLKRTVAKYGPVSVGIEATQTMMDYKSGVLDDLTCTAGLNHAVLVVGYGTTKEGVDYWIVKNSWGTGWGDKGYIKMSRNKKNQCGIASFPVIATFHY